MPFAVFDAVLTCCVYTVFSHLSRYLYCDGEPTSCCFSPGRGYLAFAGLEEGSVVVWDLRERQILHRIHGSASRCTISFCYFVGALPLICNGVHVLRMLSALETLKQLRPQTAHQPPASPPPPALTSASHIVLRSPSFITDSQVHDNHSAPVRKLLPIYASPLPTFLEVLGLSLSLSLSLCVELS